MATDQELAAAHKYVTEPGGRPRISVTSIAKLLDDGKTDALMNWTRRLAAEGKDYEQERDARGDLGTRIHDHLLAWNKGLSIDARTDELGFLDAAEKWKVTSGAESIEHEQVVVSRYGYGGRFDDISAIDGDIWGIDYKTGRLNDRQIELQHAGYWNSDGIALYDTAGMLIGTRPLPPITRWAVLKLRDDGTYDFVEYPRHRRGQRDVPIHLLQEVVWDKFRKLLDIYGWLHPTKAAA